MCIVAPSMHWQEQNLTYQHKVVGIESKESERSRVSTYVLKLVVVRASGGECRIRLRFERDEIVGLVLDIAHVSALSANGTLRCSLALRPNGIIMFQFDLHTI